MIIQRENRSLNRDAGAGREYGARALARWLQIPSVVAIACAILFLGSLAGCGGNNEGVTSSPGRATDATSSSIIAVDCQRQRAFVPLPNLNSNLHGEVAVLDLSVDPDKQNPLLKTIDIGLVALPRSTAVDFKTGTVLVLVDDVVNTGTMLLINEADDSLATVPFPLGSRPFENSGAVVDSKNGTAVVSMSDSLNDCTTGFGACTGQATFDLASRTFGPLIATLLDIDSFGFDPSTQISIASSDSITPQLFAVNVPGKNACLLDDANVDSLNGDPDAIAVDPTTDIWVAGNYASPIASVINLNGATFEGSGSFNCNLKEGGTPPNSVDHDTGTGALGMPGVAVNPVTHQAFMTAVGDIIHQIAGNQIALLSLPSSRVKQLSGSRIKSVNSTVPNDPQGNVFDPASFPYGTVVDSCHNLGYVINSDLTFVAQINLARFKKNPSAISTPLTAGSCAGTTTEFHCDNGHGVKFFPVFGTFPPAPARLPPQFRSEAFKAKKAAKNPGLTSSGK